MHVSSWCKACYSIWKQDLPEKKKVSFILSICIDNNFVEHYLRILLDQVYNRDYTEFYNSDIFRQDYSSDEKPCDTYL